MNVISIQNEERVESRIELGDESHELVSKTSSLRFGAGNSGFAMSYRRPIAVRSYSSRSSRVIRDHVMIARIGAAVLISLSIIRRYSHG